MTSRTILIMGLALQFLLLIIGAQIVPTFAKNPGLEAQVSQEALNYAAQVAVNILESNLTRGTSNIPALTGQGRVAVGIVDYVIGNIIITDTTKPLSAVAVNPGLGLTWYLQNAGLSMTGVWLYQYSIWFVKFSDAGSFVATMRGASAAVSVAITTLPNGNPNIYMLGCTCNIDKLDVKFNGGASWLYNLFYGFVESPLKRLLEKELCNAAEKVISNNAASFLQTLTTRITIKQDLFVGQNFVIDYSLISNPLFANGYIQTAHRGEVLHVSDSNTAPFDAPLIHTPAPTSMATIYVNEYVANTLGYVLYKNNLLWIHVTKDSGIQASYKSYFTITCTSGICIGTGFPAIAELYPNSFVELNVTATSVPKVSITPKTVTLTCNVKVKIFARLPDNSTGDIATASVIVTSKVSPSVRGNKIFANVTEFSSQITIESSQIGDIPENILNDLVTVTTEKLIIPRLNHYGGMGNLTLPSFQGISYVNPTLALTQGAIAISTDVNYAT